MGEGRPMGRTWDSTRIAPAKAEEALWQALRGLRLAGFDFRRKAPVRSSTVDFLCAGRNLVVEVDGAQHRGEEGRSRTRDIEDHGYMVLRFTKSDVLSDPDRVKLRILTAAGVPAGHPHPRPLAQSGEGGR